MLAKSFNKYVETNLKEQNSASLLHVMYYYYTLLIFSYVTFMIYRSTVFFYELKFEFKFK